MSEIIKFHRTSVKKLSNLLKLVDEGIIDYEIYSDAKSKFLSSLNKSSVRLIENPKNLGYKKMENKFQFPALKIEITRAYKSSPVAQSARGAIANFSMRLVDEKGVPHIVLNDFELCADYNGNFRVCSKFKTVVDREAPSDIPQSEALKPVYYCSFYPGDIEAAIESREDLFDDIAELVIEKLKYFEEQKKNSKKNENQPITK